MKVVFEALMELFGIIPRYVIDQHHSTPRAIL